MKKVTWTLVAVVVLGFAVVAFRSPGIPVELTTVAMTSVVEYIAEDAKTRLANEYVIDMPVSGTAQRIELEVGDYVEAGQIVARIDPYDLGQRIREVMARIDQARAHVTGVDIAKPKSEDIQSAEIRVKEMSGALNVTRKARSAIEFNFEEANKAYGRATRLLKAGAASESFFDTAELRYNGLSEELKRAGFEEGAAKEALKLSEVALKRLRGSIDDNEYMREAYLAEIDALEAQLSVLENDMAKTEIRSPVSGPVLEKMVEDKRVMVAGTPLLRIGDLSSIEIECDVLSEEIGRVEVGDRVEISGKALQNVTLEGRVTRIYPSGFMKISALGIEQQRVRALISFQSEGLTLRPGTSVDVNIITDEATETIAVPDRAAFRQEGQWSVFKVEGGRALLQPVTIGLRNDDWVEVREGLKEGDVVVAELKSDLADGVRVSQMK